MRTDPIQRPQVSSRMVTREELDVADYLGVLWRHRWILLAVPAVVAVLAFGYASMRTPTFEAQAILRATRPGAGEPDERRLTLATVRATLATPQVATEIIQTMQLKSSPWFRWQGASQRALGSDEFLQQVLAVEQGSESDLFVIRVRHDVGQTAVAIANRLAAQAVTLTIALNQRELESVRDRLKLQMDDVGTRLSEVRRELLTFRQRAQLELLRKNAEAAVAGRGDLVKLVIEIESERARVSAARAALAKRPPTRVVSRTIDQDQALAAAAKESAPDARRVLGISLKEEQFDVVYGELEKELALSETRLAGLEEQRRAMVAQYGAGADALPGLTELYRQEADFTRLQMTHDLMGRLYSDAATRYEQALINLASRSADLQLVSAAAEPAARIAPRRSATTAMAFVGMFLAMVAALWLLQYLRLQTAPPRT